jgi:hypothetical protein
MSMCGYYGEGCGGSRQNPLRGSTGWFDMRIYNQTEESTTTNYDNRSFWDKNSDTLRPIIIIGVAYYIWKSGMLNKILK